MIKHLIFYWYVPDKGWNDIYDLHIKSIDSFKKGFDKVTFVISRNLNLGESYNKMVNNTIDILKSVVPDADFVMYENDRNLRESVYFYNEIAMKLDKFPENEIIFFAHNKGVDSWYVTKNNLDIWIKTMYFENLYDFDRIEKYFSDENICSVGTFKISNFKPWKFLKYNWHYSGTFIWMCPYRINKLIKERGEIIPKNDRYFTEGFLGSVVPDSDQYRIGLLGDAPMQFSGIWVDNIMPNNEKREYLRIYGKPCH